MKTKLFVFALHEVCACYVCVFMCFCVSVYVAYVFM